MDPGHQQMKRHTASSRPRQLYQKAAFTRYVLATGQFDTVAGEVYNYTLNRISPALGNAVRSGGCRDRYPV